MTFYDRIEELRKNRGISQGSLEKELGFSNGSFSKWKNSMPTPERLKKLADYFEVSVDYLVSGEPQTIAANPGLDAQALETMRQLYEKDKVLLDVYRSADKDRLLEYARKLKALRDMENV